MSDAFLLARFDQVRIGGIVGVIGDKARHAMVIKHTGPGESAPLVDGAGRTVRGRVVATEKNRLVLEMTEILMLRPRTYRFMAVRALARGDHSELAVEIMTELGTDGILA